MIMADTPTSPIWYDLSPEEVAKQLQVDPEQGLSAAEAKRRLQETARTS
jgi:hypothetical protein